MYLSLAARAAGFFNRRQDMCFGRFGDFTLSHTRESRPSVLAPRSLEPASASLKRVHTFFRRGVYSRVAFACNICSLVNCLAGGRYLEEQELVTLLRTLAERCASNR